MTETTTPADCLQPPAATPLQADIQYEVIKVPDLTADGREPLKQLCFDLRIAVFVHEQGFAIEDEIDQ